MIFPTSPRGIWTRSLEGIYQWLRLFWCDPLLGLIKSNWFSVFFALSNLQRKDLSLTFAKILGLRLAKRLRCKVLLAGGEGVDFPISGGAVRMPHGIEISQGWKNSGAIFWFGFGEIILHERIGGLMNSVSLYGPTPRRGFNRARSASGSWWLFLRACQRVTPSRRGFMTREMQKNSGQWQRKDIHTSYTHTHMYKNKCKNRIILL